MSALPEPDNFDPAPRLHAADVVFVKLASEILGGEIPPDSALPSEATLAARFAVSRVIVRAAIHQLAAARLVMVKQGTHARVLDARNATDLRVIELYYRVAPNTEEAREIARDVLEKQFAQGLSLVAVFARRASEEARAELVALVKAERDANGARDDDAYEAKFWRAIADGAGNRILRAEVGWWYDVLLSRPQFPEQPTREARLAFHGELARRLKTHDGGAVAFYLASVEPQMDALFARHAKQGKHARRRGE